MMRYKILDCCDVNKSSVKTGDFSEGILYLDTGNITDNCIAYLQPYTSINEAPSRAQRRVSNNTILFSEVRPNLRHIGILENPQKNLIVSTGFCTIDVKKEYFDKVDAHFLYYLISQHHIIAYFQQIANNSASSYPSICPADIENLSFDFPDLSIQKSIVDILRGMDCKIALNRKENTTLEAMAKQLYDYWFVQFDFPDANGKPYKSSGGKMVYNETLKREIPERWEVKMLKDITNGEMESITPVDTPNTLFKHYSIPAFDSCGSYEEELGSGILSNKNVVSSKDILVSKLNPWTSRVIWGVDGKDIICSTEFVSLAPKNIKEKGFIYNLAKTDPFIAYCTKASTGTSHSHRRVNPEIMTLYPFPYCANVCQMFSSLTSEYAEKTMKNLKEIKKLENTKNFCLPLMMSGQAKID